MKINVEIAQESNFWDQYKHIINEAFFQNIILLILSRYENFSLLKQVEVSILLADDVTMRRLNKEFRGKDKTTNVLSFPDIDINWRKILELKFEEDYIYLGDVAFGDIVIATEANENAIDFYAHFTHLTIHSILHLLGYDHIKDEDSVIMQAIEVQLLQEIGIKSPY
jgi:probable rRNA maturation factor